MPPESTSASPAPEVVGRRGAGKLLQFLASGLPAFVLAVPLNVLLVEVVGLPSPLSYAAVLFLQVVANFFMLRWFVFPKKSETSALRDFGALLAGVSVFRFLDWCLYTFLVSVLGLPFLWVQLGNVVLFSLARFLYAERVLR